MKNYLNLVPISAKIHRKQSKMTRICITLAVFLVAVMFGLADMYLQGLTQKEMQENGNWHYEITSIDTKTATYISSRPEVEISGCQNIISSDEGCSVNGQNTAICSQNADIFEDVFLNNIAEGEYPNAENEIAVSYSLKNSASISLNQTISLETPDGNQINLSVVGFFDDEQASRLVKGNKQLAVLTPEGFDNLKESSNINHEEKLVIRFSRNCNIPNTIADIKAQNNISDDQLEGNIPLLSVQGQIAGETSVNQIYQVALMLSVVVMLTCVLMISSSLNSNITQRIEFFGMLRCLGATRKQIMRLVRYEGLYWCKTAIPIGIVCSIFVIWILSAIMRLISPQWFSYMPVLGISWISIVASSILGLITVFLAARSPAKRASKVSPLTAVSGNTGQMISFRKAANTKWFKIETALGIHHAKARKRNYILMTGAFAICITLFLSFTTLVYFMKNAFIPPAWTPDLSIASETNTCSIDKALLDKVNQNDAVKRAYGRMFAYDISMEHDTKNYNANLISYEENQFEWASDSLISGSIDSVMQKENQVLLVKQENSDIQVGDNITLSIDNKEHTVTVAGILSDSPLARVEGTETIFCSEDTFTALTGQNGYTIIDVQFKNSAHLEDGEDIENIFTSDNVIFTNNLAQVQQQRNMYRAFSVLVYGFLTIIVAITIFHIMNTISMGVAAKMQEYGAMRAIGMSDRQLRKMIFAEAGTYAISGVILGCVIGIPMNWVVFVSLITNIWETAWSFPFIPIGLIIAIVLLTSFLAVQSPAKRLHEMSIVENISTQ
ncbi:ABC transporter permease [Roseburia sp. TF10-5]|jgi:putative ABC transport system permease protein|uniref:ABC transporter permease n=1 Tax=Roseburia sp. TF10-5 TaxID=2293144 RepID=UPI000E4F1CFB|nr:FtsX-like permease family protein [Roseburia sp. TF10-5]RGI15235.1 ABC transporter permease [Roseburia sp. TF10-5]